MGSSEEGEGSPLRLAAVPTLSEADSKALLASHGLPVAGERQASTADEAVGAAEELGYDSGWVYQRHFDHYLSSPLPFLSAVGQHTDSISLGTAVLPMRYQDPVMLAEAAGVTDLLVGGRRIVDGGELRTTDLEVVVRELVRVSERQAEAYGATR